MESKPTILILVIILLMGFVGCKDNRTHVLVMACEHLLGKNCNDYKWYEGVILEEKDGMYKIEIGLHAYWLPQDMEGLKVLNNAT